MRYTGIFTIVILFNILAYLMIRLRSLMYKNEVFKPMIWNLKLSLIPMFILIGGSLISLMFIYINTFFSAYFMYYVGVITFFISILLWLLFLPNSAYLMTELNLTHRNMDKNEVPIWYDIISVLTLSLSGIFNTILGIYITQIMYLIYFDPNSITRSNEMIMFSLAFVTIFLVSIGMYLGREIRFNTWDLLHPIQFIKKLNKHLKKENEVKNFILFVIFHSFFLLLMYFSFAPSFS